MFYIAHNLEVSYGNGKHISNVVLDIYDAPIKHYDEKSLFANSNRQNVSNIIPELKNTIFDFDNCSSQNFYLYDIDNDYKLSKDDYFLSVEMIDELIETYDVEKIRYLQLTTSQLLNAKYAFTENDFIVEVEGVLKLVKVQKTNVYLFKFPKKLEHLFLKVADCHVSKIVEIQTIERTEIESTCQYGIKNDDVEYIQVINDNDCNYFTFNNKIIKYLSKMSVNDYLNAKDDAMGIAYYFKDKRKDAELIKVLDA
jgi:hypothetical protein